MFLFLPELAAFGHGWNAISSLKHFFCLTFRVHLPKLLLSLLVGLSLLITQPLNDGVLSGLLALGLLFPILAHMYTHIYLPIYHDTHLGHAIVTEPL